MRVRMPFMCSWVAAVSLPWCQVILLCSAPCPRGQSFHELYAFPGVRKLVNDLYSPEVSEEAQAGTLRGVHSRLVTGLFLHPLQAGVPFRPYTLSIPKVPVP